MKYVKQLVIMVCCAMLLSFAPVKSAEPDTDGIPGETITIMSLRPTQRQ